MGRPYRRQRSHTADWHQSSVEKRMLLRMMPSGAENGVLTIGEN